MQSPAEEVRAELSQAVRETELAESSRAAAVALAQQLIAQASAIEDSPAGLLLIPCAVAGAGQSLAPGVPSRGSSVISSGFPSLELTCPKY